MRSGKENRLFFMLMVFFIPVFSVAQQRYEELSGIDRFIERADSLFMRSQNTFVLNKYIDDTTVYKEKWHYLVNKGKILSFEVNFSIDSTEFTEVYYVDRNRLLCSEEYETVNFSYLEDELKWGGIYYYVSAIPVRVVTLGKKPLYDREPPASVALNRFEKRYSELQKHLPMLP